MEQEVRYPLSDNLKRIIAGENETVFRMVEDRFSVIVHSRLSGLRIEAKGDKADLQGALSMLDQVKIAAKNGTFISPHFLSGLAEKSPNETQFFRVQFRLH